MNVHPDGVASLVQVQGEALVVHHLPIPTVTHVIKKVAVRTQLCPTSSLACMQPPVVVLMLWKYRPDTSSAREGQQMGLRGGCKCNVRASEVSGDTAAGGETARTEQPPVSRFTASAQPLHHRCVQCRQLVVLLQLQVHRESLRVDEPIRGGGAFVCEQGLGLRHGPDAVVHGKRSTEFLVLVVLTTVHPHVNRQWRGWQWLAITVRNHTMFGEPGLAAGCGGSGVGGAGVGGNGATEPQVDPSLC
jgi:hypothetical protein